MNAEGFDDFERQAAEIVAAAKGLLKEFERLAGESIHQQRIAASEARVEGVKVTGLLAELGRDAGELVTRQRTLLARIEKDWQLHIDENAQRAGQRQAQEFGEAISTGLRQPIAQLTADLQRAAQRFTWTSSLKWGVGIAFGIGMTIALIVRIPIEITEPPEAEFLQENVAILLDALIARAQSEGSTLGAGYRRIAIQPKAPRRTTK